MVLLGAPEYGLSAELANKLLCSATARLGKMLACCVQRLLGYVEIGCRLLF